MAQICLLYQLFSKVAIQMESFHDSYSCLLMKNMKNALSQRGLCECYHSNGSKGTLI